MIQEKLSRNKFSKGNHKNWRLIVRNLPFDTKEEEIRQAFKKYGNILEINLPKCQDKKFSNSCAGFCFIQYSKKKSAEFAKDGINANEFKKRTIKADFAIDKDSFVTKKVEGNEQKIMKKKLEEVLLKQNKKICLKKFDRRSKNIKNKVKEEIKEEFNDTEMYDNDESNIQILNDDIEMKINDQSEDDDDNQTENNFFNKSNSEDEISESDSEGEQPKKRKKLDKKIKENSKDDDAVIEGRVVFLRNVDFTATNESLKEFASRYGEVSLAIQCNYPGTDQPCGTAFIHFTEKFSADAFLNDLAIPDKVVINGRSLIGHRAVTKNQTSKFELNKKKQPKDKRNLYLLRASLIREGTSQARGMSEQDSEIRKRLAIASRNKLKDLTNFVSSSRLAIHNIPFSLSQNELRMQCLKAANNSNAKITECRIMRDKLGSDTKGHALLGKSKGFGFVAFSEHSDALKCLQNMNNNPEIFTKERRPIVEFSIENLNALRVKERRFENFNKSMSSNKVPINKKKFGNIKDNHAVEETKQKFMVGGQKWMPKRLGKKIRHRDLKSKNKGLIKKNNSKTFKKFNNKNEKVKKTN